MKRESDLLKAGFTQHSNFWHWSKDIDGQRLDYWPNTEKAQFMGNVFYITRMKRFLFWIGNANETERKIIIECWPRINEMKRQLKASRTN